MRVLLLNQAFYPDVVSTAQHASDLAAYLAGRGHQVEAIAGARAYDNPSLTFAREESWRGVHIRRVHCGGFGKRAKWRRALDALIFFWSLTWQLIRTPPCDVVVAMTSPPLIAFLAALYAQAKGGRLIYWVMDLNPDEAIAAEWLKPDSFIAKALGWALRFTLRRSAKVIALDRFMSERLIAKGAAKDAIEIIPPWSHDDVLVFDETARDAFRREHGLEGKFVVTYSGNHSPCHPLRPLLEAARRLAPQPDIVFCFVGGGAEHGKVAEFAAVHELTNIRSLPYQPLDRIAGSLGAADLHAVVMGAPFVGIVHPCKIYNVLRLGIPVLYIGPPEGHIPDMIPEAARGDWFYSAQASEVDGIAAQILAAAAHRQLGNPEERRLGEQFSAAELIPRMSQTIESLASSGGKEAAARASWWPVAWFGLLMLACYSVVLARLAKEWVSDPNMSHGMFVPFLVGYVVWEDRRAIESARVSPSIFGIFLMLAGAVLLCIGPPGLDTFAFATRVAFLLSLVGAIIYLRGLPTLRVLIYPLLLLTLMLPLPGFVLQRLTFPLQIMASGLAERLLDLLGYPVLRDGNILRLPGETLSIAEACSGLRSLLALTFLGQAYVVMFDHRRWMRPVMALLVIPIAVFANGMRIVATAIAGSYNPAWTGGEFHESTGWVVFVVAFLCIVLAHLLLYRARRLFPN